MLSLTSSAFELNLSWISDGLQFLENYYKHCLTFLNISISDSRDWAVNVWKYWLMLFVFLNYRFQILRCAHYMILFSRMFIQLLFGMCNSWNNKNIFQILFTHSLIILPLYTSKRFLIRYRKSLIFYIFIYQHYAFEKYVQLHLM